MNPPVISYTAFSGGGWDSHTVSSAMVSSALQAGKRMQADTGVFNLDELFENVSGVAGNSGGSWFTSMLAYSPSFAQDLSDKPTEWFQSGYMGQQAELFATHSGKQGLTTTIQEFIDPIIKDNVTTLPFYEAVKAVALGNESIARDVATLFYTTVGNKLVEAVVQLTPNDQESDQFEVAVKLLTLLYDTTNSDGMPSWLNFVQDVAFEPYGMAQSLTTALGDGKISWAQDKSIIYAGSMPEQTSIVGFDDTQKTHIEAYAYERTGLGEQVAGGVIVPLSLVDRNDVDNGATLEFLGQREQAPDGSTYIGYTEKVAKFGSYGVPQTFEMPNVSSADLSVIEAATLSGTFAGGMALLETYSSALTDSKFSEIKDQVNADIRSSVVFDLVPKLVRNGVIDGVVGAVDKIIDNTQKNLDSALEFFSLNLANWTKDLALPITFDGTTASVASPESITQGNYGSTIRMIDGGYTDNTAVANALAEIQRSGLDKSFEVTAFVNNTDTGIVDADWTGSTSFIVGSDVPKLFGAQGGGTSPTMDFDPFPSKPTVAKPAIFNQLAWQGESPVWSYTDANIDTHIDYYRLDVETIDNDWWGIEADQKGVLNLFSSYNVDSGPGPYFTDAFDLYEKIYDATRTGMLSHGGYVHLLEALGVMRLGWGDGTNTIVPLSPGEPIASDGDGDRMTFEAADGLSAKFLMSLQDTSLTEHAQIDIYKVNEGSDTRTYQGSIGSSQNEQWIEPTGVFDLVTLESGDSLEFEASGYGFELAQTETILDYERVDGGYTIDLIDKASGENLLSSLLTYIAVESEFDGLPTDTTFRNDASDAYLYLQAGDSIDLAVFAAAAMQNILSMVQIDVDQSTGEVSFKGHAQDTIEFDNAVRAAVQNNEFVDKITLAPYSEVDDGTLSWSVDETGDYAPVLLTGEGDLFLAGHNLFGDNANAAVVGHNTFAFEDLRYMSTGYGDFNDAVVFLDVTSTVV